MGHHPLSRLSAAKRGRSLFVLGVAASLLATGALVGPGAERGDASSHGDGPSQWLDRHMDASEFFLYTDENHPDMVTAMIDLSAEEPAGLRPPLLNFFQFTTSGHYDLNFDTTGDGEPELTYRFTFENKLGNPDAGPLKRDKPPTASEGVWSFFKNPPNGTGTRPGPADNAKRTARAKAPDGPSLEPPQSFNLELVRPGKPTESLLVDAPVAPYNQAERSKSAVRFKEGGGGMAYAGPNRDNFLSWFHTNARSIAIQVPKKVLALHNDVERNPVVGAWVQAYRETFNIDPYKKKYIQRIRLGMASFSSFVLPLGLRDRFHTNSRPGTDHEWKEMLDYLQSGSTAGLFGIIAGSPGFLNPAKQLTQLYLMGMAKSTGPIQRDLNAHILNKDVDPKAIRPAEELRLNMTTPLAKIPNRQGVFNGDLQGWPNGRRMTDDVAGTFPRMAVGEPAYWTVLGFGSAWPFTGYGDKSQHGKEFPYTLPPWEKA